jgi:hypothetical protein
VYDEDYMKFMWHLFERFHNHSANLEKTIQIMQTLLKCSHESHTYSNRLLTYFEKCLRRISQKSENLEQIDIIKLMHKELLKKHHVKEHDITQKFGIEENNQADEEAKTKFFEMFIEANKKIENFEKQNPKALNAVEPLAYSSSEKKNALPVPDSSDEEVEEIFENDLMKLLESMKVFNVSEPIQPQYNPFEGQDNL